MNTKKEYVAPMMKELSINVEDGYALSQNPDQNRVMLEEPNTGNSERWNWNQNGDNQLGGNNWNWN